MQKTTHLVWRGVDKEPHWRGMLAEVEKSPRWETFAMWALLGGEGCGKTWEDSFAPSEVLAGGRHLALQ